MTETISRINTFKNEEYTENLKNAINAFEHYFKNYEHDLLAIRINPRLSECEKKYQIEESKQANILSIADEVTQELSNISLREKAYSDFFKYVHIKLKPNATIEKAVINAVIYELYKLDRKNYEDIIDNANQTYKLDNILRK